jgi:hypothetical protein
MNTPVVWDETFRQFRKSVGTKFLLFFVAFGALGLLVRLDEIKQELKKTREKPYQAAAAGAALTGKNKILSDAAGQLKGAGYDSSDALFEALYAKTTKPAERDDKIRGGFATYATWIDARNTSIQQLASAPSPGSKPEQLEQEIARRDALIESRSIVLDQIERDAARDKAALRKVFDDAAIPKHPFSYFDSDKLNTIGQRFADADDPISVVFDILWYAALIIGVICIVALILAPVFHALPVAGTEEKFWEQIKTLLAKTPRVARGVSGLAAIAVGAAAIMVTAGTARSSPAKEARIFVRRAYVPPAPPPSEFHLVPDPRVDRLVKEVAALHQADADHEQRLGEQQKVIADQGHTLADHERALLPLKPIPDRLLLVETWVQSFEPAERQRIATAEQRTLDEAARYADRKIKQVKDSLEFQLDATNERVTNTERTVRTAAEEIDQKAGTIANGVFQPYLIGERPAALKTLLGFDRYRATAATELILEQNNADKDVVEAVAALRRTSKVYTQSDFLRTLRVWTCHDQHNSCDAYRNWQVLVLRTARM